MQFVSFYKETVIVSISIFNKLLKKKNVTLVEKGRIREITPLME